LNSLCPGVKIGKAFGLTETHLFFLCVFVLLAFFYAVRAEDGVWYCMDNSSVSSVDESDVLRQEAYLLFYSRTGDEAAPSADAVALSTVDAAVELPGGQEDGGTGAAACQEAPCAR
jgi:hypothetical protein